MWNLVLHLPFRRGRGIMGHISRAEIRRSGGRKTGDGMALAGLVLGYIGLSIIPLLIHLGYCHPELVARENGGK